MSCHFFRSSRRRCITKASDGLGTGVLKRISGNRSCNISVNRRCLTKSFMQRLRLRKRLSDIRIGMMNTGVRRVLSLVSSVSLHSTSGICVVILRRNRLLTQRLSRQRRRSEFTLSRQTMFCGSWRIIPCKLAGWSVVKERPTSSRGTVTIWLRTTRKRSPLISRSSSVV